MYLQPAGVDIEEVVGSCSPGPQSVHGPIVADDRPTSPYSGHRVYLLEVPVGSEIDLRDCYRLRPGVSHADVGGQGEVIGPNTAVLPLHPHRATLTAVGASLVAVAFVLAGRALHGSSLGRR